MLKKLLLPCIGAVLVALLFVAGCNKKTPTSVTIHSIRGNIENATDGAVIVGATVSTLPLTISVITNDDGKYEIYNVTAGSYSVIASKEGYYTTTESSVPVVDGHTVNVDLKLTAVSNNIEWILIPSGNFIMGSTNSDANYIFNELPQHIVYLNAYQISKYEITNAQYKTFMDSGGYNDSTYWTAEGWTWRIANSITEPYYWTSGQYNSGTAFPNYPVVGVSWYEAYAFCRWSGGRLPTEAEWEKAARGTVAYYYPWGNIWDASKCNSSGDSVTPDNFTNSSPVGYFSDGVSYYGLYDMAGNVWEWCNDWYSDSYYSDPGANTNPPGPTSGYSRVVHGGGFHSYGPSLCRAACRDGYWSPDGRYFALGIRVAKY